MFINGVADGQAGHKSAQSQTQIEQTSQKSETDTAGHHREREQFPVARAADGPEHPRKDPFGGKGCEDHKHAPASEQAAEAREQRDGGIAGG